MTYTITQLQRVHQRVHADAEAPGADRALAAAKQQRVAVMDDLMARMLMYGKRTLDRDELEPNVVTMIDYLLKTTPKS